MHVIVADIQLHTQGQENLEGLKFQFPFINPPTVQDIVDAYDNTPSLYKRDDYKMWRVQLVQALNTYGVPRLDMMRIIDGSGGAVNTNMIRADWYVNLEAAERSVLSFPVGCISLTRRAVIYNIPEVKAEAPVKPARPAKKPVAVDPTKPKKVKK